jgi:hypothetical protein
MISRRSTKATKAYLRNARLKCLRCRPIEVSSYVPNAQDEADIFLAGDRRQNRAPGFRFDSLFASDQRRLSGNQGKHAKPLSNQLPTGTDNGDRSSNQGPRRIPRQRFQSVELRQMFTARECRQQSVFYMDEARIEAHAGVRTVLLAIHRSLTTVANQMDRLADAGRSLHHHPTDLPLCRGCHRPMTLFLIEPHVKYKNLDVQHFRCECGAAISYQVPA